MKSIVTAIVLCIFTSAATAQISVEEAQRRLEEKAAARATVKPATRPVVEPGPINPQLLQQALAELKARNSKEAIATATSFQSSLRRPIGKLSDPNWIDSLHIQAVAHMQLGQFDKARSIMDRIGDGGQTNRSIVVNQAILDIIQKVTAIRAVKNLKTYNVAHPDDELIVNLWGVALDTAASRSTVTGLDQQADEYLKANTILERTKPGMKHWGTEWITADKFEVIERQRTAQMRHVNTAVSSLNAAERRLEDARARHARANTVNANFGRPLTTDRRRYYPGGYNEQERRRMADAADRRELDRAAQDVSNAQRDVESAQDAVATARSKLPRPDWTMKLEPVDPELMQNYSTLAQTFTAAKLDEWDKQQSQLDIRYRLHELKGTRLGMPLEMFKARHQKVLPDSSKTGPICSDVEPDRDHPSLLYKAEYRKLGIVHAALGADEGGAKANAQTIAGAPVESFIYQFVDGKLYQMTVFFDRNHFAQVMEALKAKHGDPARQKATYENGFGARASGDALVWDNVVSEIVVLERAGEADHSLLLVKHKQLQQVVEEKMKATANKPRTDDL